MAGVEFRARHGLQGKIIAVYTGSFNEAYDLDVLLQAARQCPNVVWVLAGNGRGRPAVEAAAAECDHVIDLGSLPRQELVQVLAAADIGLLPHADWPLLSITISGKLFEYMAAGLAVVSLRDGTMGEIVRASGCGVVLEQATAASLSSAVADLADSADRVDMGARGRQWVADHVRATVMAKKIVDAIQRCRQGPQRRRLMRAATHGVLDGLRNRGERVLRTEIRPNTQALAKRTLHAWLGAGGRT
ncbi:MAG: glycosyltransferase involved in cell wall biosynthesis [Kiritimatiellia bacterium]